MEAAAKMACWASRKSAALAQRAFRRAMVAVEVGDVEAAVAKRLSGGGNDAWVPRNRPVAVGAGNEGSGRSRRAERQ